MSRNKPIVFFGVGRVADAALCVKQGARNRVKAGGTAEIFALRGFKNKLRGVFSFLTACKKVKKIVIEYGG